MSVWIRDCFGFYNTAADMAQGLGYGVWDSQASLTLTTTTRFGTGRSMRGSGFSLGLAKKGGFTNQGTVFSAVGYLSTSSFTNSNGIGLRYVDGGTIQCSIMFVNQGAHFDIELFRGDVNSGGTLIATFANAGLAGQWNQFQFKNVFSGTVGEWHVRKNGNTVDDFVATGLNNISTANSYANGVWIAETAGSGDHMFFVDFATWDTTGPAPWNNWVGDFRIIPLMPNLDASVQWAQNNSGGNTFGNNVSGSTTAYGANIINFARVVPTVGGLLGSGVTLQLNVSVSGHVALALYDSDGDTSAVSTQPITANQPGTLLNFTAPLTNPGSGQQVFTWNTSGQFIQNGHTYFLGVWSDQAVTVNDSGANQSGWQLNLTYTGTFPASVQASGATSTFHQPVLFSLYNTLTNSGQINDFAEDGATTFISTGVTGQADLYGVQQLGFTPSQILGVDQVIMTAKSDAGSRGITPQIKSGATTSGFAQIVPNTTFNFSRFQQDVDPNTTSGWTLPALNNVQIGQTLSL